MQENSDFRKIVVVGTESGRSCQSVHDATVNAFQSGSDGDPKGNALMWTPKLQGKAEIAA